MKDLRKFFCTGLKTEDALAQFKWRKINIMSRRPERERERERAIERVI